MNKLRLNKKREIIILFSILILILLIVALGFFVFKATNVKALDKTIDNMDDASQWSTSDSTNLAISQETTIKTEGTGSLKAVAKKPGASDDTITRDLGVGNEKDLSDITQIKFDIRSSRTGTYLQFGWGEVTYYTSNITINSANTWETKTIDISGFFNSQKDAVRNLQFKVTDAGTAFTAYIDNIIWANKVTGSFCTENSDCSSGKCQFNVCCESSCTGDCHCFVSSDPTEDGFITELYDGAVYERSNNSNYIDSWKASEVQINRGYVEWDVSSIPNGATITDTVFKYHGQSCSSETKYIYQMSNQSSVQSDDDAGNKVIYDDAKDGHQYYSGATFPEVGTGKQIDLGSDADGDLKNQLSSDWFAIGLSSDEGGGEDNAIYSKEYTSADPKPTLYVEYTLPPSNIIDDDPPTYNKWSWGENIGWMNWKPNYGGTDYGVIVYGEYLTGYIWAENIGWISLNCANTSSCETADYKVLNDGEGNLSGYAWGENIGWISFKDTIENNYHQVVINSSGEFTGYAWAENIGWISLNCANTDTCETVDFKVKTSWTPAPSLTFNIDSDTKNLGDITPGIPITKTTTTTVTISDPAGYSLKVHDGVSGSNSALVQGGTYITDYTGTIDDPTTWSGTGLGICVYAADTGKEEKWGTGTTETDSNNEYAGIPETATEIHNVSTNVTDDDTSIGYKLDLPNTQKTGSYSGTITYTVVVNIP